MWLYGVRRNAAIIYEDDLDGRFYRHSSSQIYDVINKIKTSIISSLGNDIDIIVLFASPEIESWFVADWEGGFGYLYEKTYVLKSLNKSDRQWFSCNLHRYVKT